MDTHRGDAVAGDVQVRQVLPGQGRQRRKRLDAVVRQLQPPQRGERRQIRHLWLNHISGCLSSDVILAPTPVRNREVAVRGGERGHQQKSSTEGILWHAHRFQAVVLQYELGEAPSAA